MGCGGSTEAAADKDKDKEKEKEKDAKAKADADAAAKAKAKADADAAAKAKADADAPAAAKEKEKQKGGKPGTPGRSTPGTPRSSSTSKPADHEANSSRNAPLIAARPDVDLGAAVDVEKLKAKFKAFAEFGDGPSAAGDAQKPADGAPPPPPVRIDGFRFAKLCRDAGLVDGKKLPLGGVDVAFEGALAIAAGKGLDVSGRKLDYDGFLIALELIAKSLGVPLTHVQLWVSAAEPLEKATQAQSIDASRPLEKPAEETEPLKPVITANKLFKRKV